MRQHAPAQHSPYLQALVGVGVLLLALGLALGAWFIPSAAGYAGVGPNFLPWVVSAALGLCGLQLIRRKPPRRALRISCRPHNPSAADTTQGKKLGPTPA